MEELDAAAYLAPEGFEAQLLAELNGVSLVHGRLALAAGPPQAAHWPQNVWLKPFRLSIRSVSDGARQLRAVQRNWALYSAVLHRRASLIQAQLPHVSFRPLEFPEPAPRAPLGSWTLLDERSILASAACTSPFPNGEAAFVEHKSGPPTRAYLKLFEALTLLGRRPQPGERCLDAGCSPGGWTWVLARLGADVLALDRAPLAADVAALPGVSYRRGSAFSLRPRDAGPFDWIFSDVVCYPERLFGWVEEWRQSGKCANFVVTVKFQGSGHYGPIRDFAAVPGSRLLHLSHNRHELTWMWPAGADGAADGADHVTGRGPRSTHRGA
jgi:23S rRNA (cytidine2498-2'-O)-methyltransferase